MTFLAEGLKDPMKAAESEEWNGRKDKSTKRQGLRQILA
jgi:hypothetical protein